MKHARLTKLELQIMNVLWTRGPCAVREVQEAFPGTKKPAYTTIQTNANIFEAVISRDEAQGAAGRRAARAVRRRAQVGLRELPGLDEVSHHPIRTTFFASRRYDIEEAEQELQRYSTERRRR
jgi:hypothetical protein